MFIRSQLIKLEPSFHSSIKDTPSHQKSVFLHPHLKIFTPGHYLLHQKTRWYLHTPLSLPSESSSSADVSVCLVLLCHMSVGRAFSSGSHRGLLSWLNPASTGRWDTGDISNLSYGIINLNRGAQLTFSKFNVWSWCNKHLSSLYDMFSPYG